MLPRQLTPVLFVVPEEMPFGAVAVCRSSSVPTEARREVCWGSITSRCFLILGPKHAVLRCLPGTDPKAPCSLGAQFRSDSVR